jgi:hypothetical protein
MAESMPVMSAQTQTVPIGETFMDKAKRKTIEEPLVPVGSCLNLLLNVSVALNFIEIEIIFSRLCIDCDGALYGH